MDLLIRVSLNSSFADWKAKFDEDAEERQKFMTGEVLVSQADEETALVVAYGVDVPAMAEFMGSPEFAEETAAYVKSHTIYSIEEMHPPS